MSSLFGKCDICGEKLLYDETLKGYMYVKYGWQHFTGKFGIGNEPNMYEICSSCHDKIQTLVEKIEQEHKEKDPFKEAFKNGK